MINKALQFLLSAALTLVPLLGASAPGEPAVETPRGIVDCLLPGQLRRVGGNIYQTPQRPARLTASECTIRGGDFLLFDRANYDASLNHWITLADRGDADAMLYVGEIYEQGIGRDPDYATAAAWFQKAADAGNTTAMISLAHLYKTGRGVVLDLAAAQALYSQAFGTDLPIPLDPTSVAGADQRIGTLLAEVDQVRRQKVAVELELEAARGQLASARQALDSALAGDGPPPDDIAELRSTIARQQAELVANRSDVERMQADYQELRTLRQKLDDQNLEMLELRSALTRAESGVELSRTQLATLQGELEAKQQAFNVQLAKPNPDGQGLQAMSAELESQRRDIKALEAALRDAEEERNLYKAIANEAATREERVATLTARIAILEQQSDSARSEFALLSDQLATTRTQLDAQVAAAAAAATASGEVLALRDDEIQRLRDAVTRAEQETQRHDTDIQRLAQQSTELEYLRANLEREQAQSNRLQQLLTESQDRFAESTTRLAQLEAERAALESRIAQLPDSGSGDQNAQALLQQRDAELHASQTETATLRAEIAATEDEFRRYQQQMADTAERQSTAIENLRAAVATSRLERAQLEERLSSASQQLASAQADLELQRQRYTELQDEVREARVENAANQAVLTAKQQELDAENQRVALLNEEIERLKKQSDRYAAEINDFKARAQAQKVEFVGPRIILAEPSEGVLASSIGPATRGMDTRGIAVVAAASSRESRALRGYVDAPAGLAALYVNGVAVPFDDKNGFGQTIELQGDLTPIRIVARDASGKEALKEFEYRLAGSTVAKQPVYSKEDRLRDSLLGNLNYYALLIANEDYENEDFASDLKTPVADVKVIGKVLEEDYGFEVEYLLNANYAQMSDALERVIYREQKDDDQANDKDAILIYYAGHGLAARVLGDNLRYFWMPVDASKSSPRTWYETIEINKYLKESSTPQIMIVADSCYAGNLPSRDGMFELAEPQHSPLFARYVEKRTKMRSRFVFTSGGNEPVLDDGGDGHSVFAREFLKVLEENTGLLAAYDLQIRVTPRVEQVSAMAGKEQSPFFGYLDSAGHEFGEFFLRAPRSAGREAAALASDGVVMAQSSQVSGTHTQ